MAGKIQDGSNGDEANDAYHRYKVINVGAILFLIDTINQIINYLI